MNQNKSGIISEKREAAERLYNMLSQVREEYVMSAIGITGEVVAVEPETGYSKDSTADSGVYKEQRKESGHGWPRWSGMLIVAASFLIIAGIFWWILSGRSGNVNSVFSEEYYHKTVSSEYDNIVYIERIKPISEVPKNQLYTAEDIDMIMKELLGATGEIREVHEDIVDEQLSSYDEYRNGAPTGKAASVTFESGYIQYIVLRDGKVTGADDPADFIDKKVAYDKGIAAIKKKYADKNLDLKEVYDEEAITVFYNPQKECYFYTFDVEGALNGDWEDELNIFVFTPMVNVNDADDIEVASSLCY